MEHQKKLYEFIERMPKVELHVHLEGSISPQTLLLLAERNNVILPAQTLEELEQLFKFKNFEQFDAVYKLISSCLKTPQDYTYIAYEFGLYCARQHIAYAEVTFSLATHCRLTGLSWQEILTALNKGKQQAQEQFNVNWSWIFDIIRDEPETQHFVLDAILESHDSVVALGLSGHENLFGNGDLVNTFKKAREQNIPVIAHAGEISGPTSIWSALELLKPKRIGHGVRCVEDPDLMLYLKEHQIPLEVCPTSNICLGVFPSLKQHPLRKLWDAGLYITVNSDDPTLFNTDLNHEYRLLVKQFNFTLADLEKINLNALYATCLSKDQQDTMAKEFAAQCAALKKELGL